MRIRLAAALLLGGAACAGAPSAGEVETYRFPPAFDVVQRVVAHDREGGAHPLLASLSRRADGLEVHFFEPVFQTPLFRASDRDGRIVVERFAAAAPPEETGRLLLEALHALVEAEVRGGEVSTLRFRFAVEAPRPFDGCAFPGRIVLVPRAGFVERIEVDTLDAACGPPPGPP